MAGRVQYSIFRQSHASRNPSKGARHVVSAETPQELLFVFHPGTMLDKYEVRSRNPLLEHYDFQCTIKQGHITVTLGLNRHLAFPVGANVYIGTPERAQFVQKDAIPGQLDTFADAQTRLQKEFEYDAELLWRFTEKFSFQDRSQDEFSRMSLFRHHRKVRYPVNLSPSQPNVQRPPYPPT